MKTIGIIGYGAFGSFLHTLAKRYLPTVQVRVYSSRSEPDGKTFSSLEEVCLSDAVVVAVPIHAFEETLKKILPLLSPSSIIVDVATVKVHTARLLKELAGSHPYVATHPMFGPESYAKRGEDVSGFRIVVTEHTCSDDSYASARSFLKDCGFDVVEMTSDTHDRHLAETLFITHLIGQVLHRADFKRTEIDTVSFAFLMDAVDSVRHDTALFKDVFKFNPYCEEALQRFERAEVETYEVLEKGRESVDKK